MHTGMKIVSDHQNIEYELFYKKISFIQIRIYINKYIYICIYIYIIIFLTQQLCLQMTLPCWFHGLFIDDLVSGTKGKVKPWYPTGSAAKKLHEQRK